MNNHVGAHDNIQYPVVISAMVYLAIPEEWQRQSSLLLQARPTTVRKCNPALSLCEMC